MEKEKVILLGSGGHAKIVIDIIELENKYQIHGIVTNDKLNHFYGYEVIGNDGELDRLKKDGINKVAIGVGGFKNNELRKKIFVKMQEMGFEIVNAIHPSSIISKTVEIGKGVVIFAGVVINSDVKILNNSIIATNSSIDHESTIGNHCLVSAGVTIGANVNLGDESLCALGSSIISQISVFNNSLIGAGAVVVKDITEQGTYMGIPARKI